MKHLVVPGWKALVPTSLKEASVGGKGALPMTQSLLGVIKLDDAAAEWSKDHGEMTIAANDAYYEAPEGHGGRFCIEFKSGREIKKADLDNKMAGSPKVCVKLGIMQDEAEAAKSIHYVLVYNENIHKGRRARLEKEAKNSISGFITGKSSRRSLTLFGVEKYEGQFCRLAETMTEAEFDKLFVQVMEKADPYRVPA